MITGTGRAVVRWVVVVAMPLDTTVLGSVSSLVLSPPSVDEHLRLTDTDVRDIPSLQTSSRSQLEG